MNYIYGINAVTEALKARGRTFAWVGVAKERHDLRLKHVVDECRRQGIAVRFVPRDELDDLAGNNAHQGVVAATSAKQYNDLEDVVAAKRGQHSLVVVLDGVEDPHNLGAVQLGAVVTRFDTPRREAWLTIDDGPDGARSIALAADSSGAMSGPHFSSRVATSISIRRRRGRSSMPACPWPITP